MGLDPYPGVALSSKEIIPALSLVDGTNALKPVIAKETMEDGRRVEARDDEATNVWEQADGSLST